MGQTTRYLKGSNSRDLFKSLHKTMLPQHLYALDCDLELVEKYPEPFVAARLDFKLEGDDISFAETIAYNRMVSAPGVWRIPVYIVQAKGAFNGVDPAAHRFAVYEYISGDWRPHPPQINKRLVADDLDWNQLGAWEDQLRAQRRKEYHERRQTS